MAAAVAIPEGFEVESAPIPEGFEIEETPATPSIPEGFEIEAPAPSTAVPSGRFGSSNAPWPTDDYTPPPKMSPSPEDAAVVLQAQAEGKPVIMVDGKPTVGEKPPNDNSDLGQRFLGSLAKNVPDIAGGAAGLIGQYLAGTTPRDLEKWNARILEIGKKPSVFDDFTEERIRDMTEVPPGYRTPEEEFDLKWLQSLTKSARNQSAGAIKAAQPFVDFQQLSTLASKEASTFFGQNPARQDYFLSKLVEGAGSLPPYIASAMAGGPVLSMFVGSLQTAQNEHDAAIEAGHPELADQAFDNGLLIGLTEGAGVGGGTSGAAKKFGKKVIEAIKKGVEEGGQEWVQNTLSNLNASTAAGYDPSRPVLKGSGDAALIGFLLGGGVETLSQIGGEPEKTRGSDAESAETEIDRFEREKADAIASANALKETAARAAEVLPAASQEAAALAAEIEQKASEAAPPVPSEEPAEETTAAPAEAERADAGEVLFPNEDLSTRSGDPVKTEQVVSVSKTKNEAGQDVYAVRYEQDGKKYVGFSDNPAWELHEKFKAAEPTPAPPATAPAPTGKLALDRMEAEEASLAEEPTPEQSAEPPPTPAAPPAEQVAIPAAVPPAAAPAPLSREEQERLRNLRGTPWGELTDADRNEVEALAARSKIPAAPDAETQARDEARARQDAIDAEVTKARIEGTERYTPSIRLPDGTVVKSKNAREGHGELSALYPEQKVERGFVNNQTGKFLNSLEVARENQAPAAKPTPPTQKLSESKLAAREAELADEPPTPEVPEFRIAPKGDRFIIIDRADKQVGRSYVSERTASAAIAAKGQPKRTITRETGDTFKDDPIIDAIIEAGGLMSKSTAQEKWSAEKWSENKGEWDDAPQMQHPTHNTIYKANGIQPNEMAGILAQKGLLKDPALPADMWAAINKATVAGAKARKQHTAQKLNEKTAIAQAKDFEREVLTPKEGVDATPVSDLKIGDELQASGETFTVTDLDPDTDAVTIEDGERFKTQIVGNDQTVYGTLKPVATDAINDWPDIDTEKEALEYAKNEGIIDESEPSPDSLSPSAPERDADTEGQERDGGAPPAGAGTPATQPEIPLERARRVVAERQADLAIAREEGDTELVESLGRVLGKLRKDLAAEEAKAEKPEAATPSAPVEMWQRTRDQVGTQLAKHRESVRDAVKAGKPVPDEVLAEYAGAAWADKELSKRAKAEKKAVEKSEPVSDSVETTQNQPDQKSEANLQPEASLPKLRSGKSEDALLQGENDVFNLVSETATDKAARLKREQAEAAAQAARDAAEAKALQDKQQTSLFETEATQKPDKIEQALDTAIDKLKSKPGELFADPLFIQSVGKPVLRAALQVVRAAYKAGKSAAQAIADGMAYLKANVPNLDEVKAQAWLDGFVEPEAAPPPKPPIDLPKQSGDLPETTAAYNAETDKLLARGGMEPIAGPAKKALGTSWDEARAQVVADPGRGTRLVEELNANPRALADDVESGILLNELATRKAEQVAAQDALNKAAESGDAAAIADAKQRLTDARNKVFEAITAAKLTGTAWGRAGRFRQVHIDQDFSLIAMEAQWRSEVNGGKPLTEEQTKLIAELHQRIADSEAKIAAFEAKEAEAEAKRVFDQVVKESKAEAQAAKKTHKSVSTFLHEQAAAAKARIIARRGKLFTTVDPLNIAGLVDEAIIGADHIANGLTKLADWSAAMLKDFGQRLEPYLPALFEKSKALHLEVAANMTAKKGKKSTSPAATTTTPATPESVLKEDKAGEPLDPRLVFDLARAHVNAGVEGMEAVMKAVHADLLPNHPDLTEREVRDAFSGYGKVTYPSKEEDLTKLREYRTLARLTSQLEDAERRIAPLKTGPQRDKASQKVRELTQRVKETMRRLGIETTTPEQQLKTSLDGIKTRLRNQIEDLNKQIATRTKPEGKTPVPYDAEAEALRAERDRLSSLAEEIFGKPELTDEQRIAAATKALDKAIAEEDAMLKAGILKRPAKESKTPVTAELEAKRAMLDSMRDLRRELADAAEPKKSPEERALEGALKAARASIERYDEMLRTGKLTPEALVQKFSPTSELETLWNERNALRDAVAELRAAERPKQSPEESARKAALKALDKRITELDRRLREGDFTKPARKEGNASQFADVQSRRAEAKALADLYKTLEKAQQVKRSPEEIQLGRDKKLIAKRTAELERRVKEGDYAPRPPKPKVMDAEKEALLFENAKAKEAYNRGLFEEKLKQRSLPRKLWDATKEALNTSRAILTSFDLSAVFRQGGFIAFGHPVRAARSIVPMLRAFASEKKAMAVNDEIKGRRNAPLYDSSKLFLSDQDSTSLTKLEEQFMSRFIQKSEMKPGETGRNILRAAKNVATAPVRASARAYTTFLNKLRADSFDAMANTLGGGASLTPVEAQAIANFINVATGRGALPGKAAQAAAGLNSVFFAPRYVLSRFQLLAGQPLYGGNARTRALIAGEYARYLIGAGLVYALAMAAQDDDDPVIELDPTSSDFLKVRFGDTRLDPMSGLLQATVFAAREGEAIRRFVTQDDSKEPKYGSGGDVLARFLRSKLSPAVGTVVDALAGKDVTGQKITPSDAALRLVTPISMGDILKTMEEQGVAKGTALSLLSLLGMGLQTYAEKNR